MAYTVKYRMEYADRRGTEKRIDILENDFGGDIIEVVPSADPFILEMSSMESVFDPVVSIGATLNMISDTNFKFTELYSVNPVRYQVRAYCAGVPVWAGYVNAEGYTEPYCSSSNYEVSIECNDGFAILRRFRFLNGNGDRYTGLVTIWNLLKIITDRMGLPFTNLMVATGGLKVNGVQPAAEETLLHALKVNCDNYYDEEGGAMTFAEVLRGVLRPLGLQIRREANSIMIYEPQMLCRESIAFKVFDTSFSYTGTTVLRRDFDISSGEASWTGDDQTLTRVAGGCMQKLHYSPYSYELPVERVDVADSDKWTGTAVWTFHESDNPYYSISGITQVEGFTLSNGCLFGGRSTHGNGRGSPPPECYLECGYQNGAGTGVEILRTDQSLSKHISGTPGSAIRVKFRVFVKTHEDYNGTGSVKANSVTFSFAVRCGGLYARFTEEDGVTWVTGETKFTGTRLRNVGTFAVDEWCEVQADLPWNFPPGRMEFILFDDFRAFRSGRPGQNPSLITSGIETVRFTDFEFLLASGRGNATGLPSISDISNPSDVEYTGRLNEDFENEMPCVDLIHGEATGCIDRGGIYGPGDAWLQKRWQKESDTETHSLHELLLRSIISEYRETNIQLHGTIDADTMFGSPAALSFFCTVEDTDYLANGEKLMCIAGVYSDFNQTFEGDFMQLREEDLTIVVEEEDS